MGKRPQRVRILTYFPDRLGRSLAHLVNFLSEIHAKKVDLFMLQQGLDTTTPAGVQIVDWTYCKVVCALRASGLSPASDFLTHYHPNVTHSLLIPCSYECVEFLKTGKRRTGWGFP